MQLSVADLLLTVRDNTSLDPTKQFQTALTEAQVESNVRIYDGVGHAFWKDMEQIEKGDQPQLEAYQQVTSFLKEQFS